MASSDLLPVERTRLFSLLLMAIRMFPRMRAWMFSSVVSSGFPRNTPRRPLRYSSNQRLYRNGLEPDPEVARELF